MARTNNRRVGSDRGATLITFALSLVAICTVIALVIGGSIAYEAERNSQTASDTAALAAANTLRAWQRGDEPAAAVATSATVVGEANGADEVECYIVNEDYAATLAAADIIAPCDDTATWTAVTNAAGEKRASGVLVDTDDTRSVPFGEVAGQASVTGSTVAAAAVQPVIAGKGPFLLCSTNDGHPEEFLTDLGGGKYEVNEAALYDEATDGPQYVVWGTDVTNGNRQCGGNSEAWRGFADESVPGQLPGPWEIDTGNKTGKLPRLLTESNACTDFFNGSPCTVPIPICVSSNGETGTNLILYCVALGSFEIQYYEKSEAKADAPCQLEGDKATKVICGKFLGGSIATGGTGGTDVADEHDVVVIKLVE